MVMPDELDEYGGKSAEELRAILRHRDEQISGWLEAWKYEQGKRLEAERALGQCRSDPTA